MRFKAMWHRPSIQCVSTRKEPCGSGTTFVYFTTVQFKCALYRVVYYCTLSNVYFTVHCTIYITEYTVECRCLDNEHDLVVRSDNRKLANHQNMRNYNIHSKIYTLYT